MISKDNNYAFIDSQNLNLGIMELGWKLDFKRFRIYLAEKYGVKKAYLFIGYIPVNQRLYQSLQKSGYELIFKPVLQSKGGYVKGNIDAELVLQAITEYKKYDKALVVTSDGDFYCLINYFYSNDKLKIVLAPNKRKCSILLIKAAREKIVFMDNLRHKLEYKKKKHR